MVTSARPIVTCLRCGRQTREPEGGLCAVCAVALDEARQKLAKISRPERVHTKARISRRWTDEEDEIVRRDFDGTMATNNRLARQLGRSAVAVKSRGAALGVNRPKSPNWTAKEMAILHSGMEREEPPRRIVARLKAAGFSRGWSAVHLKLKRLCYSSSRRSNWFTQREVCELIGFDHRALQLRISRGELPASRYGDSRSRATWQIKVSDLRTWVLRHREELSGRAVDIPGLIELLVPGKTLL